MATSSEGPGARGPGGLRSLMEDGLGGGREGSRDHLTMLSGTAQNLVGLVVFSLAGIGMKILIPHAFGKVSGAAVLGVVILATQFAFIVAAATRFGMDMAATRRIAIEVGSGERGRARAIVRYAMGIAAVISVAAAAIVFVSASWLAHEFKATTAVFQAVAVSIPFVALCQTWVAASRGLKIMTHTLYAYWVGQSVSWIVFSLVAWQISKTPAATVYAYAASWLFGTMIAGFLWNRSTGKFERVPAEPRELNALLRYGAPRAPAALLSQAIFWTDYFVLSLYTHGSQGQRDRGVYAAAVNVALTLVLFLTAVSYMFSPFVADLHEKGERRKLDGLFKSITRWTLAATLPILSLLIVVPGPVLHLFGGSFTQGQTALRILLIGQIVNVSVGAAGFILIMTKRTGWDLVVYASSFLLDIAVSFVLIGRVHMGSTGAAIAQTTTIAFSNALRIYLVWRFVGIHPYNRYYFRLVLPFGVCLATMFGVAAALSGVNWPLQLMATGAIGVIVYAAVLAIACLTPTERAAAKRLLRRAPAPAGGQSSA